MRAYERLLNYVKVWTTSDEESTTSPTTARQFDLAKLLVEEMKKTPVPDGVVYEPGINALEALPVKKELETITYGEMPVQIGYCNGHNSKLNAVEYHRSSEINVAATDAILILGLLADVAEDFTYDTSKMEAFLVPAGTGVEVFATSLHYAPCGVDGHQKVEQGKAPSEDALLAATNKWLIGHAEGGLPEGSFLGLVGENLDVSK